MEHIPTHYPCVYVNTLDEKISDYDWLPIGLQPNFFPGMEMEMQGYRWVIKRVFVSSISAMRPVLYVYIAPAVEDSFVTEEHEAVVDGIYEFHANRQLKEAAEDALGDHMAKDIDSIERN